MKSVIRRTLLVLSLGSLSALAVAGTPADEFPQCTVKFADLNMNEAAGIVTLFGRIERVARVVCEPTSRDLRSMTLSRGCADRAIAHAVAEVNAPLLTSYYLTKSTPTALIAKR